MTFVKRLGVPLALVAAVGLVVAFGPSLMARAHPSLPRVSPQQLVANMLGNEVEGLSGTVEVTVDLGLPELPGGRGGRPHDHGTGPRDLLGETHTLRVAVAGPKRQRVAILDELAQYTVVHNGRDVWAYDSARNRVLHWRLPATSPHGRSNSEDSPALPTPPQLAQRLLAELESSASVRITGTTEVAGRPAYTVALRPDATESLVGSVRISVDARTWTPLRVTVTPSGSNEPAIDIGFREVRFETPPASRFRFTPPEEAEVEHKSVPAPRGKDERSRHRGDHATTDPPSGKHPISVIGHGWTGVLVFGSVGTDEYMKLIKRLGSRVSGDFGHGYLITTRLLSVLVTDEGRIYVGAVTPQALKRAAERA